MKFLARWAVTTAISGSTYCDLESYKGRRLNKFEWENSRLNMAVSVLTLNIRT